jgi:hypothetical protein
LTLRSPLYRTTQRRNVVNGIWSMSCEKTYLDYPVISSTPDQGVAI